MKTTPAFACAPVREFGCVKCQKYHRQGFDEEYEPHLYFQSKHGWRERPPTEGEKFERLLKADENKPT